MLFRLGDELWIDDTPIGVATTGAARWRPGHPDEIVYIEHRRTQRAGVFLFERALLRDLGRGVDRVLIDVDEHGWEEAGHVDWRADGEQLVFAAREPGGEFLPRVLDVDTGIITTIDTDVQVIDTAFTPDGQIVGIDTSAADRQFEPVAWIALDGEVEHLSSSTGVNRDPAISPDGRYVANIRASGPLARVFLGRWDLVVTDLTTGSESVIGDGRDGFGPPRWIDERTLIAKHGRYDTDGVIAALPDVAVVDAVDGHITIVDEPPSGAWDPDPEPVTPASTPSR